MHATAVERPLGGPYVHQTQTETPLEGSGVIGLRIGEEGGAQAGT